MVLSDPRALALYQLLRGGDTGLDLTGRVERGNARAIEQEYVSPLRRPLCDRFI